ncbi:MAG: 2-oxo acid dehydrogenase subunit E2 [Flavobacteriales bacterium]|jgi:2-oxoglutarate dehydrogenase E2 component (dihydrolipoamide succinyltransferase)|nr:2-oxo acid dehydrogenase subunit E2 [Flavobacteriales bacterium]
MANIDVLLPKMGESVAEATITTWLKEVGDKIEEDEPIVEIATDKVDSEVPAPVSGILVEKKYNEGDVVEVGAVFAIIGAEGEETVVNVAPQETVVEEKVEEELMAPIASNDTIAKSGSNGQFFSPLVRSIAQKEGVSQTELEQIQGTGQGNRVTKRDILSYLENRSDVQVQKVESKPAAQPKAEAAPAPKPQVANKYPVKAGPNDEIVEMDRMRKLIATHMVDSVQTSPHVTSFVEADVTNIVMWRNKMKDEFLKREGEKLTFTPLFMEAVIKALKDFPMVNSALDGDHIVIKKDINLGMATALPSGNLIVPVIHNADQLNLTGLAKKVNGLANNARNNKLSPDEIQGGTYTVTNVGTFGNVMGTPIINQPQSAILALGAIRKKPAVIETPQGDTIGIRHMMFLSHSYDHRIVDGALGGSFVKRVADYLEQFDINREL